VLDTFGNWGPSAAGRADARARVASAIMQTNAEWFEGEERDAIRKLKASYQDYKHASSRPDHAALISDRMVERYAIAGDAVEVSERLASLLAHPHLDRVVLTPQGGATSLDEVLLFLGKAVLPLLRHMVDAELMPSCLSRLSGLMRSFSGLCIRFPLQVTTHEVSLRGRRAQGDQPKGLGLRRSVVLSNAAFVRLKPSRMLLSTAANEKS
jgi:hypothetical protein